VERNLPRAILIAIGIATLLYIGISTLAILVASPVELGRSDAPLADIYSMMTGREPYLITVISLFAVINGALVQIIMASRVFYGMSARNWMPEWFGRIHPRTHTPVNATLVVVILILILAVAFPLVSLAKATSYCLLIIFALVNLSLMVIKLRARDDRGMFTVPIIIPVLGLTSCGVLLLSG
jgi:amino acid transporter